MARGFWHKEGRTREDEEKMRSLLTRAKLEAKELDPFHGVIFWIDMAKLEEDAELNWRDSLKKAFESLDKAQGSDTDGYSVATRRDLLEKVQRDLMIKESAKSKKG